MWGYEKPYMVDLKAVEVPSWVEQDFIRKNIFSRPDVTITRGEQYCNSLCGKPRQHRPQQPGLL